MTEIKVFLTRGREKSLVPNFFLGHSIILRVQIKKPHINSRRPDNTLIDLTTTLRHEGAAAPWTLHRPIATQLSGWPRMSLAPRTWRRHGCDKGRR